MAGVGSEQAAVIRWLRKDCFNAVVNFMVATRPDFDAGVATYA